MRLKALAFLSPFLIAPTVFAQTQTERLNSRGTPIFDALTNRTTILISGATPSVAAGNVFKTNNAVPTTITNFLGDVDSQRIVVNCGDTNTTIQNNANIVSASASDIVCSLNKASEFVYDAAQSKWVQTSGGGAGSGSPAGVNNSIQKDGSGSFSGSTITDSGSLVTVGTDSNFKGPNPYIDVRAYGVRAVSPIPSTTGTINSGFPTLTLAAASTFINGDGIVVRGAGATNTLTTPSAPTVSPSNAQVLTGTGFVVANTSGATTYQYQIVARTLGGGYTVASSVTSIANGPATLGANNVNISSWTQSGQTVTVNTSSAHNLVVGSMILIAGAGNANGWWGVATVPSGTRFTFNTTDDTALGAPTSGGAAGTVTWYNCNHITWSTVTNAYEYFIYGRAAGAMNLIGISLPQSASFGRAIKNDPTANAWDDFGSTMTANISSSNVPDWVPLTPPVATKNDDLVTTIVSGAGTTTLTLAANASNSVTAATTKFDNAPNIVAAAAGSIGKNVLYFPATGTSAGYSTQSVMNINQFPNILGVKQGGQLFPGDTMILGNTQWSGDPVLPTSIAQFQLWKLPAITTSTAFPMIYSSRGVNKFDHVSLTANQPFAVIYLNDEFGGIPGLEMDHMNFTTIGNDYMSMHFIARGDANSGANIVMRDIGVSGGGLPNVLGVTATPLFYFIACGDPSELTDWSMSRRGLMFAVPSGTGSGPGFGGINAKHFYIQGGVTPLFTDFTTGGSLAFTIKLEGVVLDTSSIPQITWFGTPKGNVTMAGASSAAGQPQFNGPPGRETVTFLNSADGGASAGISRDTLITSTKAAAWDGIINNNGMYSATIFNQGASIGPLYQAFVQANLQPAPTCVVSAGGTVTVGSYTFQVAPAFPNGGLGALSPASTTCTTTSGNQTITITWAPVAGASGYNIYENGTTFSCGGVFAPASPGNVTSYVWTTLSPCNGLRPTIAGSGPSGMSNTQIWSQQFKMVATDETGTLTLMTPTLSANRSQAFPDGSGTLLLDSSIGSATLSAYDTFNRANGNCGSNWTGVNATGTCTITSNAVATSNGAMQIYFYNAGGFAPDQFSEVRLSNVTATVEGAAVRASQTNNEYACRETTTTLDLGKIVAGGGFVSLGSTGISGVNGDIIRLEVEGSNLTCYRNGVSTLTASDSSLATGQPGVWTGGTSATVDNWHGGSLHPVAKLDRENDWVQPQHFTQPVTIGDPAPIAGALSAGIYDSTQTASLPLCADMNKHYATGVTPCTAAITETFTNKTIDAEGTGNVITIPFKPFIGAAVCNNAKAGPSMNLPTAAAPQVNCNTGTNVQEGTLDFADSDSAQFGYFLPNDWTGAIDARALFFDPDTSGTVIWNIATACSAVGGSATDDPVFNTASAFGTITLASPANAQWAATVTGITTTGCSAGNGITFKVSRAADSGTSRARLKGIELTIRRAM